MWLALLFVCSSAIGLALGLARLKVFALIPATIILLVISILGCFLLGGQWGTIAFTVIANVTLLQSSYLMVGVLSHALSPRREVSRTNLRANSIRAARLAIGEELQTYFQPPQDFPSALRTRIDQLALRFG